MVEGLDSAEPPSAGQPKMSLFLIPFPPTLQGPTLGSTLLGSTLLGGVSPQARWEHRTTCANSAVSAGGSNPTHTMNRCTKEDRARTNRAGQCWMVERMPVDWEPHAERTAKSEGLSDAVEHSESASNGGMSRSEGMFLKNDRPTEESTTSHHEWTGEEVTIPTRTQGGPPTPSCRSCSQLGSTHPLKPSELNREEANTCSHSWTTFSRSPDQTRWAQFTHVWETGCGRGPASTSTEEKRKFGIKVVCEHRYAMLSSTLPIVTIPELVLGEVQKPHRASRQQGAWNTSRPPRFCSSAFEGRV